MANLTRQQTRYMSRDEFNALDKSTIPAGTEINIVDQIQKEDLSTELLNAIESGSANLNIENGTGTASIKQSNNPTGATINIQSKNPNAYSLDNSLTATEPIDAKGESSAAFGGASSAQGKRAFAHGTNTIAKGKYSHSEGDNSVALGVESHAEGYTTVAFGDRSHSEGDTTTTKGVATHAEGYHSVAEGDYSHAEGRNCTSSGNGSHAEGTDTVASGNAAHSAGNATKAVGESSHAEGQFSESNGLVSHAEGYQTIADGDYSHTEGNQTAVKKVLPTDSGSGGGGGSGGGDVPSDPSGWSADDHIGENAHAEGYHSNSYGFSSHTEGAYSNSFGHYSHTEGVGTTTGKISNSKITGGTRAHAEGFKSRAEGDNSHAEGFSTNASGENAHAEGSQALASGVNAHAEGAGTKATGDASHAQGNMSEADGAASDAGGSLCKAKGDNSFVRGYNSVARLNCQSAIGNELDSGSNSAEGALFIGHYNAPEENAIFQIGVGSDASDRKNLLTVYEDPAHSQPSMTFNGNASITGDTTIGTLFVTSAPVDENGVIRKQDLDEALSQVKPSWHSEAPADTSKVLLTKLTISPTTYGDLYLVESSTIVGGYQVNYIYGTYPMLYTPSSSTGVAWYANFTGNIFLNGGSSLQDAAGTINTSGMISCVSTNGETMFKAEDPGEYSASVSLQFFY